MKHKLRSVVGTHKGVCESLSRCARVTHEKVCVYTHLYVCYFEDQKRGDAVTHLI